MQNLNIQKSDSLTSHFDQGLEPQISPFSSTELSLKQRYMQDFLKDLKKSDVKATSSSTEVLFKEIKGLLEGF